MFLQYEQLLCLMQVQISRKALAQISRKALAQLDFRIVYSLDHSVETGVSRNKYTYDQQQLHKNNMRGNVLYQLKDPLICPLYCCGVEEATMEWSSP